jgi:hypothetical protein
VLNIFGHALSCLSVGSPMGLVVGLGHLVFMCPLDLGPGVSLLLA